MYAPVPHFKLDSRYISTEKWAGWSWFLAVFDKKGYLDFTLNHTSLENSNDTKRVRPTPDIHMESTAYTNLSESEFYNRSHDVFTLFLIYLHIRYSLFHGLRDCIIRAFQD